MTKIIRTATKVAAYDVFLIVQGLKVGAEKRKVGNSKQNPMLHL